MDFNVKNSSYSLVTNMAHRGPDLDFAKGKQTKSKKNKNEEKKPELKNEESDLLIQAKQKDGKEKKEEQKIVRDPLALLKLF